VRHDLSQPPGQPDTPSAGRHPLSVTLCGTARSNTAVTSVRTIPFCVPPTSSRRSLRRHLDRADRRHRASAWPRMQSSICSPCGRPRRRPKSRYRPAPGDLRDRRYTRTRLAFVLARVRGRARPFARLSDLRHLPQRQPDSFRSRSCCRSTRSNGAIVATAILTLLDSVDAKGERAAHERQLIRRESAGPCLDTVRGVGAVSRRLTCRFAFRQRLKPRSAGALNATRAAAPI